MISLRLAYKIMFPVSVIRIYKNDNLALNADKNGERNTK